MTLIWHSTADNWHLKKYVKQKLEIKIKNDTYSEGRASLEF